MQFLSRKLEVMLIQQIKPIPIPIPIPMLNKRNKQTNKYSRSR